METTDKILLRLKKDERAMMRDELVNDQKVQLSAIDVLEREGPEERLPLARLALGYTILEIKRRIEEEEGTPVTDVQEKLGKVVKLYNLSQKKTDKDEFDKLKGEVIEDVNGAVDEKMFKLYDGDLDELWD